MVMYKSWCVEISRNSLHSIISQPAFTCSKLNIETLEHGVKYAQKLTACSSSSVVNFEHLNSGWDVNGDKVTYFDSFGVEYILKKSKHLQATKILWQIFIEYKHMIQ